LLLGCSAFLPLSLRARMPPRRTATAGRSPGCFCVNYYSVLLASMINDRSICGGYFSP
jgi:hypothetical protein